MDAKTLCLGVLYLEEASGYEIKKRLEEGPFGQFQAPSFGSIYPALNTLCEDGLLSVREEAQIGRPDKRVYRITAAGRHALVQAITAGPGPDRIRSDFLFVLFFGDLLSARHLDDLFEERLASLRRCLADMDAQDRGVMSPGRRFVHGMAYAILGIQVDYIEDHRHELVAAALDEAPAPPAGRTTDKAAPTIPQTPAE